MEDYTVYENAESPLLCKNKSKSARKKIVLDQLEKVGIIDLQKKYPSKISGGQRQRCAIARVLASGNDIILADEPTGALDKKTSNEIMQVFREINSLGKTIIIITHSIDIANQCDRIIQIEDGKVIADSEVSQAV